MLKHNKAKNQQPSPDRSRAGSITGSSLVDVTFREREHTAVGAAKASYQEKRRGVRPASARVAIDDEPLPSTLVGLGWSRARSLKEKDAETPAIRSRRPARARRSGRRHWLFRLLILVPLALGVIFEIGRASCREG